MSERTPADEAKLDSLLKYIEFLKTHYYIPRARNNELAAYLAGHAKAPHWYDADQDEVPW